MQNRTAIRFRTAAILAVLTTVVGLATACGDDDESADDTTTAVEPTEPTDDAVDPLSDVVDEAEGSFELTTSDGSMAVAGTAQSCTISDDRQSIQLVFTGSAVDVDVDAGPDGGTVTVTGQFEGAVETLSIDDTGEVAIAGTGGITDDSASPTTFEVNGTCP